MARSNDRGGNSSRRAPKDTGRRIKKKPCALCKDRVEWVDYKEVNMLRKYMSDRGKIRGSPGIGQLHPTSARCGHRHQDRS